MSSKPLNQRQQQFFDEWCRDHDHARAHHVAYGTTGKRAASEGARLLRNAKIAALVAEIRVPAVEQAAVSLERTLRELWLVATTDARELIEFKVGCCRHCFGEEFRWQRTVAEHNADYEKWIAGGGDAAAFDEKGGIGFDARKAPRPDCPECMGEGHGRAILRDTRYFSPGAVALYAGVKQTKTGLEVQMHDKLGALEKLMRHLGAYEADNSQKRTPLQEALAGFMGQIHADEAGKLSHTPAKPRLVASGGKPA